MKKNENKNNGDQSDPDEEDDIPLKTLIPTNQSDVTTEISQDRTVNNQQDTAPIYRSRKKYIGYLDVSLKGPALPPDLHDILSLYGYFKLFAMTEIMQKMAFETNRYNLQRFGEDMRIPCTSEELEKIIGYFRMDLVKIPNQ